MGYLAKEGGEVCVGIRGTDLEKEQDTKRRFLKNK